MEAAFARSKALSLRLRGCSVPTVHVFRRCYEKNDAKRMKGELRLWIRGTLNFLESPSLLSHLHRDWAHPLPTSAPALARRPSWSRSPCPWQSHTHTFEMATPPDCATAHYQLGPRAFAFDFPDFFGVPV